MKQSIFFAKALIISVLIVVVAGCEFFKIVGPPPPPAPPTPLTEQQKQMVRSYLGKGYFAWLDYANPTCMSQYPLFDPEKLVKTAYLTPAPVSDKEIASGHSILSYSQSLGGSVSIAGSYGLFSGAVKSTFDIQTSGSSDNSFYTVNEIFNNYCLAINPDTSYLLDAAQYDIDNLPPWKLINKYGTHFIQNAFMGGRISYSTYINHSTFTDSTSFTAGLKAAYQNFTGEANISSGHKDIEDEFSQNSTAKIFGGDPSLANSLLYGSDQSDKSANLSKWIKSIDQNMTIADFGKTQGLTLISALASTKARGQLLQDSIYAFLLLKGQSLLPRQINKNSTVMLLTNNGSYASIPLWWGGSGNVYHPMVISSDSANNFRLAGLFTFNSSSSPLMGGNSTTIMFKETALYPNWQTGDYTTKETNSDWLNTQYLKLGGPIPSFSLYWKEPTDSWSQWVIKKVSGGTNSPILSGDPVYIYNQTTNKYLHHHVDDNFFYVDYSDNSNGLPKDDSFIWKFVLVQ